MDIETDDLPGNPLSEFSTSVQQVILKAVGYLDIRRPDPDVISVDPKDNQIYFGLYATGLFFLESRDVVANPGDTIDATFLPRIGRRV